MALGSKLLDYRNPRHADESTRRSLLALLALVLPFVHAAACVAARRPGPLPVPIGLILIFGPYVNLTIALLAVWRIRRSRGTLTGEECAWIAFFIDLVPVIIITLALVGFWMRPPFN